MKVSSPTPPMRDVGAETRDTLQAQVDLAPAQLSAYEQTAPGYDAVDLQRLRTALGIDSGANLVDINNMLTGAANQQTIESNRAIRQADLADAAAMGGQARDLAMSTNPDLWHAIGRVDAAAQQGVQQSPFLTQFGQMAQQGLGGVSNWATMNPERVSAPSIGTGYSVGTGNYGANTISSSGITPDVRNVSAGMAQMVAARSSVPIADRQYGYQQVQGATVNAPGSVGIPVVAPSSTVNASAVYAPSQSGLSNRLNYDAAYAAPTGLEQSLVSQARNDLNLGTRLSPEEIRQVQQASRAAATARGLQDSNSALASEAVNTYQMGQQRYRERQQAASGINELFRSGQQADRGYGMGVEGLNQAYNDQAIRAMQGNQQSSLQAQIANQGSMADRNALQAQLGIQAGLQNQDVALRAALANQSSLNQASLANQSAHTATTGMNAETYRYVLGQQLADEQQRAFANQQAQLTSQGYGVDAQRANQAAALQASQMSLSDNLARQTSNQNALNEALRQYAALGLTAQQSNQQDAYNRAALGGQLSLQAQLANQAAGNDAQQYNSQYWRQTQLDNAGLLAQQMGLLGQAAGMQQAQSQDAFSRLQAAAQARMATYQDPMLAILGRQSSNIGTNAALMGAGQNTVGANSGYVQSMFNPFNSYANDVYGSNQSAVYNTNIANANARAGIFSGLFGGIGQGLSGTKLW